MGNMRKRQAIHDFVGVSGQKIVYFGQTALFVSFKISM